MDKVTIIYSRFANTLDVWWGNPNDEEVAEETGEEIILKKDKDGKVIGFEKLNYLAPERLLKADEPARLPVEVVVA